MILSLQFNISNNPNFKKSKEILLQIIGLKICL